MPLSTVKAERRKKSRKRPPILVYVELASANGGMVRDLSEEGFAVRAMMPLRTGENTPFSFSLNESIRIEGEGEILWIEENGRVAGVRFTGISSLARAQIHDWLSGSLDAFAGNEASGKFPSPPSPSLAQLREEIRSAPPREEPSRTTHAGPPEPAPEPLPAAPTVIPGTPQLEHAPFGLLASVPGDASQAPAPETPADSTAIPGLPPLSQTPSAIDPIVEPPPSAQRPVPHTFVSAQPAEPLSLSAGSEGDPLPPPSSSALPDISEILIQPHGNEIGSSSEHESLSSWEQTPETPRAGWAERFTLSDAITIMLLLTLVAAISVYHREVGHGLIWLGEQMGGSQINQSSLPGPTTFTPSATFQGPQAGASSQGAAPAESAMVGRESPTDAGAMENNSQTPLSTVAKSALPPVTPLSGISAPSSSGTSQEAGQAEYVQAMQLLRGKNASADRSYALRLLWISVEKGNSGAELELAELYWHGVGVARNCDQTRILLSAAARKGSAEAQKRLQQFQREGCE